MQIDQEEDVSADEAVGGVREEVHHGWADCKEIKPRNKTFKNAFPLCLFSPTCVQQRPNEIWHLEKKLWTQSTLRPWRIIKVPSVLLSRSLSVCPLLLLLLLRPPLPFPVDVISESSRRLPDNPDTHTHAHADRSCVFGDASFSFRSRRQRLPRRALAHCKVMLKYFRTEMLSVFQSCSFSSAAAAQNSKANFLCLWEKGQKGSNERITQTKLNAVVNLLLCEKLISSFALRKKYLFYGKC